jgi:ABC-type uncharacterized transport system involved in gliding motility auxiliary subunit
MGQPRKRFDLWKRASATVGNVTVFALTVGAISLFTSGLLQLLGRDLRGAVIAFLSIGLIGLLVAAATGYQSIRTTLLTRRGFYGFNATAMILIFLAIAAVVVLIGARNNGRLDVTATREFTLSRQTIQILDDLDRDIEAVAFFVPTNAQQIVIRIPVLDLLTEYEQQTSRFSFRFVDPELEPAEARRFGINADLNPGTIVFSADDRRQPVASLQRTNRGELVRNITLESDFTQAILAVTNADQGIKLVYFMDGHQERDPFNDTEGSGFALARFGIEGDNYRVDTWNLATEPEKLAFATVLVIAAPQADLLPEEQAILDAYLELGGKAIFLLDPETTPPTFNETLKKWGVELGDGNVVDFGSSVSGVPRAPLVPRDSYVYPPSNLVSPITAPVTNKSFYQGVGAILPLEGAATNPDLPNVFYDDDPNFIITPLALSTTPRNGGSWLETDPEENNLDDDEIIGPLALGVAIEAKAPFGQTPSEDTPRSTRIVVFGDSDFASNRFFSSFANGDIFLNSINWLAGDVDLISVRPKLREPRFFVVTQGQWNFIRWSSLLILPLLVSFAGAFIWWQRR